MVNEEIKAELFRLQDVKYKDFQSKLIPTVDPKLVIGVRTPELRKLAKQMGKRDDINDFLSKLPHEYFDENQLHAFIISEIKDYSQCMEKVCRFLPYVDNWATCDQMSPGIFKRHKQELLVQIQSWIDSSETYTLRFAIRMLMGYYLDQDFDVSYLKLVAGIQSDEYYVNMMIAWYFATALAKQYEAAVPFLENKIFTTWVHNKTIQKAIESNRISTEQKAYLRSLKNLERKGD